MDWKLYEEGIKAESLNYGTFNTRLHRYEVLPIYSKVVSLGKAVSNLQADVLFEELKSLAEFSTLIMPFSTNRQLVLDFINHFKEGSGVDFSNDKLNKIIQDNTNTISYFDQFTYALENSIRRSYGQVKVCIGDTKYRANEDNEFQKELNNLVRPKYNKLGDKISGTFFMINDTHGITVDVLDYTFCNKCNNYKASLRLNLYDNFGLDQEDVEKFATANWGVYGWFVLQHYNAFKTGYKPFITRMTAKYPIGVDHYAYNSRI